MSKNQSYEEGYTFTYTTPNDPQHAWKSISLTVRIDILPNVIGNRYGFMTALKKFHDIAVNKKITRYHITNVQSHSVRNEVSPDWLKEDEVHIVHDQKFHIVHDKRETRVEPVVPMVPLSQQELELSQPNKSEEGK